MKGSKADLMKIRTDLLKYQLRFAIDSCGQGYIKEELLYNRGALNKLGVNIDNIDYTIDEHSILNTMFVGLFWFDKGYTCIEDVAGVVEITEDEVSSKLDIYQRGFYRDFYPREDRPRGRVALVQGDIVINVGLKCDLSDDIVKDMVKKSFGLDVFKGDMRVVRGYNWDAK